MKSLRTAARDTTTSEAAARSSSSGSSGQSNAAVLDGLPAPTTSSATPILDLIEGESAGTRGPKFGNTGRTKNPRLSANPGMSASDTSSYGYKAHEGSAFIKGTGDAEDIDVEDVKQGSLGDCYWVAAMAATAQANPEAIRNAVHDNGDGTYNVTLYKNGKPKVIKVDNQFPSSGSGMAYAEAGDVVGGKEELWPALLEKAWAIMNNGASKRGYETIEGGAPGDAVQAITGKKPTDFDPRTMSTDRILSVASGALDKQAALTCATLADEDVTSDLKKDFDKYGFYANHCYTFYGVDVEGGVLKLRNPWGSSHPKPIPVDVFKKCFDTLSVNKGV